MSFLGRVTPRTTAAMFLGISAVVVVAEPIFVFFLVVVVVAGGFGEVVLVGVLFGPLLARVAVHSVVQFAAVVSAILVAQLQAFSCTKTQV